jgi:tetratricopeptide (TPR) repeat protein
MSTNLLRPCGAAEGDEMRRLQARVLQHPYDPDTLRALVHLLLERGDYLRALPLARRYVLMAERRNRESRSDAWSMCANAYYHLGEPDLALEAAEQAVGIDGTNSEGWEILSLCYYEMEHLRSALYAAERAYSATCRNCQTVATEQRRRDLLHLLTELRRLHHESYGLRMVYDSGARIQRESLFRRRGDPPRSRVTHLRLVPRMHPPK